MLGTIIGDLAGSIYEYDEFKSKEINLNRRLEVLTKDNLIDDDCFYSDDTILTIAILDAILDGRSYEEVLREYGLKYYKDEPNTKASHFKYMFSPTFIKWCKGQRKGDSAGNGALMRVSPIGYLFDDLNDILRETKKATIPSHNSKLAIKSSSNLNTIIYMMRKGYADNDLREKFYPISRSIEKVRLTNSFDSTCLVLDNCLMALFESSSFEEAVRIAVSLGGDTDTVGAITGSLAEAYYGIPLDLKSQALEKLPEVFVRKLERGYQKIKKL